MAKKLVLDVDWNIAKAEAKARKLQREFEISTKKAKDIASGIKNTENELEKSYNKSKYLRRELNDISNTQFKTEKKMKFAEKLAEAQKKAAQTRTEIDKLNQSLEKVQSSERRKENEKNEITQIIKSGKANEYTGSQNGDTELFERRNDLQKSITAALANEKKLKEQIKILETQELQETQNISNIEKQIADDQQVARAKREKEINAELSKQADLQRTLSSNIEKQKTNLKIQEAHTENITDNVQLNAIQQKKLREAVDKTTTAVDKSQSAFAKFGKRIKELVKSALIFSVITKALNKMKDALSDYLTQDKKLAASVSKLKGNLATIGTTITSALSPYIQWFLDKLVTITAYAGNLLARALGKDVKEMSALAKNAEKTAEATKNTEKSLAGFDTLNKLSSGSDGAGSDGADNTITTNMEAIDTSAFDKSIDKILKKLDPLKGKIKTAFEKIADSGKNAFEKNRPSLEKAWDELIKPIGDWAYNDFQSVIEEIGLGVSEILNVFGTEDFATVLNGLIEILSYVWSFVQGGLEEAKNVLRATFNFIAGIIDGFIQSVAGIFTWIKGIFQVFSGAIQLVVALFKGDTEGMTEALEKMKEGARNILNGIIKLFAGLVNSLRAVVNFVWEHIVGALRGAVNSFGGLVKKVGNKLGFEGWGWKWEGKTPIIPKWEPPQLATGAILPGGSPMLAMVNDQPKGKPYIEGSIDNIAAAFKKYLGDSGYGTQNLTIEAKGSMAQFIRMLNLQIKQENTRATIF